MSPDGGVFVGDIKNGRVRAIDTETGVVTTAAGNGHSAPASGPSTINDQSPSDLQKGLWPRGGLSGDEGPAEQRVRDVTHVVDPVDRQVPGEDIGQLAGAEVLVVLVEVLAGGACLDGAARSQLWTLAKMALRPGGGVHCSSR